jgi:DNA polymerase III epsilon subunit-like protein
LTVSAHNARFDYNALNTTQRWLTKSKYRYFFPYGTEVWDTLKMARSVVSKTPTYKRFCQENNYMTKNNQVRLTAEILYRYITRNLDFIESHTGLEDVEIERQILSYCFRKHKAMKKALWNN